MILCRAASQPVHCNINVANYAAADLITPPPLQGSTIQ